jgi:hypothetical protein
MRAFTTTSVSGLGRGARALAVRPDGSVWFAVAKETTRTGIDLTVPGEIDVEYVVASLHGIPFAKSSKKGDGGVVVEETGTTGEVVVDVCTGVVFACFFVPTFLGGSFLAAASDTPVPSPPRTTKSPMSTVRVVRMVDRSEQKRTLANQLWQDVAD